MPANHKLYFVKCLARANGGIRKLRVFEPRPINALEPRRTSRLQAQSAGIRQCQQELQGRSENPLERRTSDLPIVGGESRLRRR